MKADDLAVLVVGDELLDARAVDTNSHWITQRAAAHRWRVDRIEVVGDDVDAIASSLHRLTGVVGAVIVSGGLGPTPDDLTREALAKVAGEPLTEDPALVAHLSALFASRGRAMSPSNLRQAMRCASSEVIDNPVGTAPGLWHVVDGTAVVLLPGVPAELQTMWERSVEPRLAARLMADAPRQIRLRTTQIAESVLADRVREALGTTFRDLDLAWCVAPFGVDLIVRHTREDEGRAIADRLRAALGEHVFTEGLADLPEVTIAALRTRGDTVAVAESCTGGLVGAALTAVPGSSDVFVGGVLAYANAVKEASLGIDPALLAREGAVSEPVARAMAVHVRHSMLSTWGVSTTGIAGPSGGTPEKPVGTVWIALAGPECTVARRLRLGGDRSLVRRWTVAAALDALRRGPDAFA
jgi:nicotinamide-nucleotide amidase